MPKVQRSESSIQKAVIDYARKKGCICIKQTVGKFGSSGWPDYLLIDGGGNLCFIEFKKLGGKLTPLQKARFDELINHNIYAFVVNHVGQGKLCVNNFLAGLP